MSVISINKESLSEIIRKSDKLVKETATPKEINAPKAAARAETAPVMPAKKAGNISIKAYQFLKWAIPPVFGILLLLAIWSLISYQSPNLPGPVKTWDSAITLFSDPFYDNGPNDKGVGWNILASLQRVGLGFGLAALVGIPLGFIIGRFEFAAKMCAPVISLLRPV
jgi:nitrate/nitrite transport system permease protein